jgi:hypothetical protein
MLPWLGIVTAKYKPMKKTPSPQPQKKSLSAEQVFQDEKFEQFLAAVILRACNPPTPPKGKKYIDEPWKRLTLFNLDNPKDVMREYHAITSRISIEKPSYKKFILSIIRQAVVDTLLSHNEQPEPVSKETSQP